MCAAVVTFFGIQAQATTADSGTSRALCEERLRPAILNYMAVLASGMVFPLHRVITIVLWNT